MTRQKFILSGKSDQVEFKKPVVWVYLSYFGHKHVLAARLQRFFETGILGFIKESLRVAKRNDLLRSNRRKLIEVESTEISMGLDSTIVLIFYVHLCACFILICFALLNSILHYLIGFYFSTRLISHHKSIGC